MKTWLLLAIACRSDEPHHHHEPPTDGDADADTDADADSDTAVTGPTDTSRLFDDDHVLVIPDGQGLTLLRHDGTRALFEGWGELVGPCAECGGEGSSADGDGLLLAFTTLGPTAGGAIARIDADRALDWRLDGFQFPHDAVRDPADQAVIVPEVGADRMTWIAGDGSSPVPIRALDEKNPDWPGELPNGIDRLDYGGRTYLVSSHRGEGFVPSGEITFWDVTDPAAPALIWTYPPEGPLDTPHGAMFREYEGRWWMLYAHSVGKAGTSTVGLAVTDDPTVAPAYVADLVPVAPVGPFVFLRGVELTSDGWLWLTDSGFGGPIPPMGPLPIGGGRIVEAPMPDLEPTGAPGSIGGGQVFVDLDGASVVLDGLVNPFEAWLWAPPATFLGR